VVAVSDIKQVIGSGIRSIRKAKGISQESLAHAAGFSPSYMGEVERGLRNISIETLGKISDALGVSPFDIIRFSTIGKNGKQNEKLAALEKHLALMTTRNIKEIELIHKVAKDILAHTDAD
jgi:transcriptional regulator with XRE-family HTH domain